MDHPFPEHPVGDADPTPTPDRPSMATDDQIFAMAEAPFRPSRTSRGHAGLAWIVIVLMVITMIVIRNLGGPAVGENEDDPVGVALMKMQAQYMVGAAQLPGGESIYSQAQAINVGSVGQRQRFVVVAAEMAGPDEAGRVLDGLDDSIEKKMTTSPTFELTETQVAVQEVLAKLYDGKKDPDLDADEALLARIDTLSKDDRELLVDELGWFGELALLPHNTDDTAGRADVMAPATRVVYMLMGTVMFFSVGGILGLIGLIVMLVLVLNRTVTSGLGVGTGSHGIYAETFAFWLVFFFLLQIPAGIVAGLHPAFGMAGIVGAFFVSLLALYWPVMRGVPWSDVRRDIGWTMGRNAALEPIIGVGGYFMALPLVGVGILLTLVLLLMQGALSGAVETFAPSGGPAHPVVLEIANGNWPTRIQVLILASIAAPIVEETMFRGVLYRHLRDASARLGIPLSVLLSGTINAFLFAAIHPQGWVAIPALMSLAYAFLLMREWRGSVVPSMIIHGISNGIVMSLLILVLGSSS